MVRKKTLVENILKELRKPMFQDTPNEFAYVDFRKWAYKNRGKIKAKLSDALGFRKEDGTGMFIELANIWRFDWADKFAKEWSYLHSTGLAKSKFGRALAVMMKKDNLIINRDSNLLLDLKESNESEWNSLDVSRKAEKELSNKEWNERTAKKLTILKDLNSKNKFKKDWDEEKLQGWIDQNYSWEKLSRQFKLK